MPRLAPTIVGVIALVVYALTLMPGMAFGDWGEMQTVPHVLGVAHPTGYPTYIVLSWLAQLVPLGSIAFRANLLSAILVSGALATTVAILMRLGTRPVLAAAAATALGAIPTVWAAATVAEVNPLHLLFVALLLQRAVLWEDRRWTRDLVLGALMLGLALGNHMLIVFVGPFIALFVLWVGRREIAARPWILAPAIAVGALGVSVYLYIPLAANGPSPLQYNDPVTFDALLWLASGTQFRDQFGFLSASGLADVRGSLGALWHMFADRATTVVPILGLIGLVALTGRRPGDRPDVRRHPPGEPVPLGDVPPARALPARALATACHRGRRRARILGARACIAAGPAARARPRRARRSGSCGVCLGARRDELARRGSKRRSNRRSVRRRGPRRASAGRGDPLGVGRVDATLARPTRPGPPPRRPDRRRHEHRL